MRKRDIAKEAEILRRAGTSETEIMIATGRKPISEETMMGDIIYPLADFLAKKAKFPHMFKGVKTKTVLFGRNNYVVTLSDWS